VTREDAESLERTIAAGGIALFPADTVYGLAVDPESESAVERLYELKGRPPHRPAAVMFFDLDAALGALRDLPERTLAALQRMLPGGLTAIVPNLAGLYPLACGPDPARLGVRVPRLTGAIEPLAAIRTPVMQSSANRSGGADARRLEDVDPDVRAGVDVELDGGELPGTPSTVVDLSAYDASGEYRILREGAVQAGELRALLDSA
jgi:L-threonylcarbamoyladenylate synthase